MKVIEKIKKSKKPLLSFEILPPLKGRSIQTLYEGIDPMMEFNPAFINVTYHREEYVYKKVVCSFWLVSTFPVVPVVIT